jgi:hypothetical protein
MPLTKQNLDVASGLRYSQEVIDFCEKNGLVDKLECAVEILNEAFPEAEGVTVEVEQDPDSRESCVMVNALVAGNANDVRLRHRQCVRRLLKQLKWPASTLVRTTYTLA